MREVVRVRAVLHCRTAPGKVHAAAAASSKLGPRSPTHQAPRTRLGTGAAGVLFLGLAPGHSACAACARPKAARPKAARRLCCAPECGAAKRGQACTKGRGAGGSKSWRAGSAKARGATKRRGAKSRCRGSPKGRRAGGSKGRCAGRLGSKGAGGRSAKASKRRLGAKCASGCGPKGWCTSSAKRWGAGGAKGGGGRRPKGRSRCRAKRRLTLQMESRCINQPINQRPPMFKQSAAINEGA